MNQPMKWASMVGTVTAEGHDAEWGYQPPPEIETPGSRNHREKNTSLLTRSSTVCQDTPRIRCQYLEWQELHHREDVINGVMTVCSGSVCCSRWADCGALLVHGGKRRDEEPGNARSGLHVWGWG